MTYEELQKAFDLSDEVIESYKKYAALLKEWNEKINLTSITEESEVIEKHFYDSLLPTKEVKFQKGAYLDMGTGAGFPGMVIAIAHPELYVTLADSTKKKFIFLQAVKDACGVALMDAKKLVDGAPTNLKENISKEDADALAAKLKEAGAEVEIK